MNSYTKEVKRLLIAAGCWRIRQGRGDHEVWRSPVNGAKFVVDGNIKSRHTANKTLRDAGLDKAF